MMFLLRVRADGCQRADLVASAGDEHGLADVGRADVSDGIELVEERKRRFAFASHEKSSLVITTLIAVTTELLHTLQEKSIGNKRSVDLSKNAILQAHLWR